MKFKIRWEHTCISYEKYTMRHSVAESAGTAILGILGTQKAYFCTCSSDRIRQAERYLAKYQRVVIMFYYPNNPQEPEEKRIRVLSGPYQGHLRVISMVMVVLLRPCIAQLSSM